MTQAKYKSSRLLVEAINNRLDAIRRAMMGAVSLPWGPLNELKDLVDQLAEMAGRKSIDDVKDMPVDAYVATMKPLVAKYHVQLFIADQLAPCLCEDLGANAAVVILIGNEKTVVRTARHPDRPDAELAVEAILASIEAGTKRLAEEATTIAEAPGEPTEDPEVS